MADPKIIVNGKEYPLVPPDDMTLGEAAEAERITGQGYDWDKRIGGVGMLALTYIAVKRIDPRVTLADLEGLHGEDLEIVGVEDGEAIPPASRAASSESGEPSTASGEHDSVASPEPTPAATGTEA